MGKPTDLVQGTVDLLILKTIALEPLHGWAIAQRIRQLSEDILQVQQGSLYPRCSGSRSRAGSPPNGAPPKTTGARGFTVSPRRARSGC